MKTRPDIRGFKKARHREMLIEATADLIAEEGIARTSITRIIEKAGLSRGMVHLHFENKDDLMLEVAKHVAEQYFVKLDGFLERAGPTPQERLEAIVTADLSEVLLNRNWVNIWVCVSRRSALAQRVHGLFGYARRCAAQADLRSLS